MPKDASQQTLLQTAVSAKPIPSVAASRDENTMCKWDIACHYCRKFFTVSPVTKLNGTDPVLTKVNEKFTIRCKSQQFC